MQVDLSTSKEEALSLSFSNENSCLQARRNVYEQNLVFQQDSRRNPYAKYREISSKILKTNVKINLKANEWLHREARAFYPLASAESIEFIVTYYISVLRSASDWNSVQTAQYLQRFIPNPQWTIIFVRELCNFLISPFDLKTYDLVTRWIPDSAENAKIANSIETE